MIWFSILTAVVSAFVALLGIVLAIQPPDRAEHKTSTLRFLAGLAIVLLLCSVVQPILDAKDKAEMKSALDTANGKLTQEHADFLHAEDRYQNVIRVMANSTRPIEAALQLLSESNNGYTTNDYFNPQHLDELLKNEEATLTQKRADYLLKIAPIADYALKTLNAQVENYASQYGDKLASAYEEFPAEPSPSGQTTVIIQLAKNQQWKFECLIVYYNYPAITIMVRQHDGGTTQLTITRNENTVGMSLLNNASVMNDAQYPLNGYQPKLNELLGLLIAKMNEIQPLQAVK